MNEHSVFLERSIAAPAELVWRVLTDIDAFPRVLSEVVRVERMTDSGYVVGTRWVETRTFLGQESSIELEVTANDELHSTTVAAQFGGVTHRTQCWLQPIARGTLLQMRSVSSLAALPRARRMLVHAAFRASSRADRKRMEQELDDIARAAEEADAGTVLARR